MPKGKEKRHGKKRAEMLLNPAVIILVCVGFLAVLGISILFSATAHSGADPYYFLKRQLIWLAAAVIAGAIVSVSSIEPSAKMSWLVGIVLLVGLVLVLIPGIGLLINGSRRWLPAGPMRIQVSEFAKLGMVFILACYFWANQRHIQTFWRGFVVPSAIIGLFSGLILLQPDYGTAALCGVVGFLLMYLAGVRLLYLVPSLTAAVALFSFAVYSSPVRWRRIMAFLDIEGNQSDGAYQLWQAIIAFGAGGIYGSGLGNGRQQMAFLPEAHTDFIFAVIGEELGLVFTGGVLLFFLALFLAGINHLRRAPNLFHYLLVCGALLLVTLQALINMAVVTGCLPTKGMSLPFISYGGSNLVVMFAVVGLLVNAALTWTDASLPRNARSWKEMAA